MKTLRLRNFFTRTAIAIVGGAVLIKWAAIACRVLPNFEADLITRCNLAYACVST
jgi:hypothetical protein